LSDEELEDNVCHGRMQGQTRPNEVHVWKEKWGPQEM